MNKMFYNLGACFVLFGAMILCKQVSDINDQFLDDVLIMICPRLSFLIRTTFVLLGSSVVCT